MSCTCKFGANSSPTVASMSDNIMTIWPRAKHIADPKVNPYEQTIKRLCDNICCR